MKVNTFSRVMLVSALIAGGAVLGFFLLRLVVSAISPHPDSLGVQNGKLAPCPSYPNCVSSQATDEAHAVQPIPYAMTLEDAIARILHVVNTIPRSTIVTTDDDYVHVEFRTAGLRYIDDIEFYFDEKTHLIQIRSAARLPYYDFQVNRRRAEFIRDAFLLEGEKLQADSQGIRERPESFCNWIVRGQHRGILNTGKPRAQSTHLSDRPPRGSSAAQHLS